MARNFSRSRRKNSSFLDFVEEKSRILYKPLEVYSRGCAGATFAFEISKHEEAVFLFGSPDEDFSRRTTHMRGRRPVPYIGNVRYATLLVEEFRTSKCCSNCGCFTQRRQYHKLEYLYKLRNNLEP